MVTQRHGRPQKTQQENEFRKKVLDSLPHMLEGQVTEQELESRKALAEVSIDQFISNLEKAKKVGHAANVFSLEQTAAQQTIAQLEIDQRRQNTDSEQVANILDFAREMIAEYRATAFGERKRYMDVMLRDDNVQMFG